MFNGEEVNSHEDLLPECTDIVYIIEYTSGQLYIGKKAVRAMRKYPPLKGKKRCRRKLKDLPFVKYEGSSTVLDEYPDLVVQNKIIIYQCSKRKASTYLEAAMLFTENAIFKDNYLNRNISGTFYPNDLDGVLAENGAW